MEAFKALRQSQTLGVKPYNFTNNPCLEFVPVLDFEVVRLDAIFNNLGTIDVQVALFVVLVQQHREDQLIVLQK